MPGLAQAISQVSGAGGAAHEPPAPMPPRSSFASQYGWHGAALCVIAAALLVHALTVLAVRWHTPLLGMHAWRQTQTAITSYWMLKGSPWLAYQTPVFGPPWSLPFEFPLYQLLVAGVVKLSGIQLDSGGRLVSEVFLLLLILPVAKLARSYGRDSTEVIVFVILLLGSPVYLYWGSAFLIESCALFFSFMFLAALVSVVLYRSSTGFESATLRKKPQAGCLWHNVVVAVICGTTAALVKITTYATFYALGGCILVYHLVAEWRSEQPARQSSLLALAVMAPPVTAFTLWDRFADGQKATNAITLTQMSTSEHNRAFIFGSWHQLFSWQATGTLGREVNDTLGGVLVLIILVACLLLCRRWIDPAASAVASTLIAAFLFPFAVFTNLYVVHNYYFSENAIFLIAAAAVPIGTLFAAGRRLAAWGLLILITVSQLLWFYGYFVRDIVHPSNRPLFDIAMNVKANTDAQGLVMIYGQEWSPVIPYYSERRALMEPEWMPMADAIGRLRQIDSPMQGHRVEALVRCPSPRDRDPEYRQVFNNFDVRFGKQHIGGCDVYFVRSQTPPVTSRK